MEERDLINQASDGQVMMQPFLNCVFSCTDNATDWDKYSDLKLWPWFFLR